MKKLLYLSSFFFLALNLQGILSQADPNLQKCKEKILSQISSVKFGQYPKCFDASKMKQVKNNTDILHEFYQTLTENCKSPTAENIKTCLEHFKTFMKAKSPDFQAGMIGAINSFFDASKDCINSFVDKVGNMDEWVLNGCEDELPTNSSRK